MLRLVQDANPAPGAPGWPGFRPGCLECMRGADRAQCLQGRRAGRRRRIWGARRSTSAPVCRGGTAQGVMVGECGAHRAVVSNGNGCRSSGMHDPVRIRRRPPRVTTFRACDAAGSDRAFSAPQGLAPADFGQTRRDLRAYKAPEGYSGYPAPSRFPVTRGRALLTRSAGKAWPEVPAALQDQRFGREKGRDRRPFGGCVPCGGLSEFL